MHLHFAQVGLLYQVHAKQKLRVLLDGIIHLTLSQPIDLAIKLGLVALQHHGCVLVLKHEVNCLLVCYQGHENLR